MGNSFSGCEIIEISIGIEENGKAFYAGLAEMAGDGKLAEMFRFLAGEEDRHIDIFRKLRDSSCDFSPQEMYPDEYFSYIHALADENVFTEKENARDILKSINRPSEGINIGIKFEKDSILFFEEIKKMVSERTKNIVEELIEQEKKHLQILVDMRKKQGEI